MMIPLSTALVLTGVSLAALLTALAVVMGFLAHEPLLILLGLRGQRAQRDQGTAAARWLALTGATALGAGLLGLWMSPPHVRWAFALPLAPAALLVPAIARGREKSWQAEVSVALAFSFAALPVCMAAGVPAAAAFSVAMPFAVVFVAATLAVRVVILRVRGGGDRRAIAFTRVAVLLVVTAGDVGLAAAAMTGLLAWTPFAAALPGSMAATAIAIVPPPAGRLRTVGWTLVAVSLAAAVILVVSGI